MSIHLSGADELESYLQRHGNLNKIKMLVRKHGSDLQKKMQRKADFRGGYATGDTKRSIGISVEDGGMTAVVKPNTEYSPYLEYGTRFMSAQPFVRPALDEVEPRFKADIRTELSRR